jgi:hypothetical protein
VAQFQRAPDRVSTAPEKSAAHFPRLVAVLPRQRGSSRLRLAQFHRHRVAELGFTESQSLVARLQSDRVEQQDNTHWLKQEQGFQARLLVVLPLRLSQFSEQAVRSAQHPARVLLSELSSSLLMVEQFQLLLVVALVPLQVSELQSMAVV